MARARTVWGFLVWMCVCMCVHCARHRHMCYIPYNRTAHIQIWCGHCVYTKYVVDMKQYVNICVCCVYFGYIYVQKNLTTIPGSTHFRLDMCVVWWLYVGCLLYTCYNYTRTCVQHIFTSLFVCLSHLHIYAAAYTLHIHFMHVSHSCFFSRCG